MSKLKVSSKYNREDVHNIFSPETVFTPQSGTWGLQGFIPIPDRESDYVFLVTFGQKQAGHEFDESITEDGVLTWESQGRQALDNVHIKKWISHDELESNIYFFLRTEKKNSPPYCYMGRLKYLTHDVERERPVYFQWQLLDWGEITKEAKSNITLINRLDEKRKVVDTGLIKTEPPRSVENNKEGNRPSFKRISKPDYSAKEANNRTLGLAGELMFLKYEEDRLLKEGALNLVKKLTHVSIEEGDGAGYDIRSYSLDGSPIYLEVKTTTGSISKSYCQMWCMASSSGILFLMSN